MALTLWTGNDNLLRMTDLVDQLGGDEATPTPVTSATVTAQIKDNAGSNVGGAIALTYVAGTDSDYEGTAEDTLALTANEEYSVEITADDGPGRRAFWVVHAVARVRTS